MKPTKPPDKDDVNLFREAVGPIRRLRHQNAQPHSNQTSPEPEPRQSRLDEARVTQELLHAPFDPSAIEIGEELNYLKPGIATRIQRQLRRGQFSVQADIDLHHMTADAARIAIKEFLDDCRRNGELCVKIIHGKGLRSKADGPVLKRLTDHLLRRRSDVLAFASARAVQGGTGAVIVLLQRL
jgi:DNA-nicking Smr family endonuclease